MIPGLNEAVSLFGRASLHFLLLVLPGMALCVFAVRRGLRNSLLLAAIGLAGTALTGYAVFFLWFLSFRLVRPLDVIFEAAALVYLLFNIKRLSSREWAILRPLMAPTLLVWTSTLIVLASAFAYGGLEHPLETAQTRFSHVLPVDNRLPFRLAGQMMSRKILHPFWEDWLASDRPPLATGIMLSQYPATVSPRVLGYQVLSALEQSLWIFGLWLLLSALHVHRRAIAYILAGSLFTSLVFVNTLFVWPKLLSASYFLGFAALLLGGQLAAASPHRMLAAIVAGFLCACSLLSHGGSLFAFLGMTPVLLLLRPRCAWKSAGLLIATAAIAYLPWSLYQKFGDPPGDRLLKWHLAGVVQVDSRSFSTALVDSYRSLTWQQIYANKASNFEMILSYSVFFKSLTAFVFPPATALQNPGYRQRIGRQLNAFAFFSFIPSLGFYVLGLPLLLLGLLRRFRSIEWKAAALLWIIVAAADFIWCCLMFGPYGTIVHQGSYAIELMACAAGILCFWSLSEVFAILVVALQMGFFLSLEFLVLVPPGTLRYSTAALAGLAFLATAYLLSLIGRERCR